MDDGRSSRLSHQNCNLFILIKFTYPFQGKIKDNTWIEKELRPKFKQSFVHLIRMTEDSFYNSSSVFELFGLDLLLDEDLNVWFIECNASPQLIGTNERKTQFLVKMLFDLFEIQHAYLKSRLNRAVHFVREMTVEAQGNPNLDYSKFREEFEMKINLNKLDPQYPISSENGFQLIMDRNLEGSAALFGHISEDCVEYS